MIPACSSRAQTLSILLAGSGTNKFPFRANHIRNNQLFMTCKIMLYVPSVGLPLMSLMHVLGTVCKLSIIFSRATEYPHGCWIQLGTALRMAQDVGAHRLKPLKTPTAENEHWKRAFWSSFPLNSLGLSLIYLSPGCFSHLIVSSAHFQDVNVSYRMRSGCFLICFISWVSIKSTSSSYDVELPIECDDEYWDHPDLALNFKQPSGKPSSMSFFLCYLRLHDILAAAMRTLVSSCMIYQGFQLRNS
jgi:hypothetical protein